MAKQPGRLEDVFQAKRPIPKAVISVKSFDCIACVSTMIVKDGHVGNIFNRNAQLKSPHQVIRVFGRLQGAAGPKPFVEMADPECNLTMHRHVAAQ